MTANVSRRAFLETAATAGTGLLLGFHLPAEPRRSRTPPTEPFAPNAWLRIGLDDSVTVLVDRSEMGQGVATALPMLIAEELEADWQSVRIEFAPAAKEYFHPMFGAQGTGGSSSVRAAFVPLRRAGATARELLVAAAAAQWGVDRGECHAAKGAVHHAPTGRELRYGALAGRAATFPVPADVPLKPRKDWTILGTPIARLDTVPKVTGKAEFGIDVKVPGMQTAVIARCPVFGGTVAHCDATAALAVPGVRRVVEISSGVAVVADGYWAASQGREALTIQWDEGPRAGVSSATISKLLLERAATPGVSVRRDGDPAGALPTATATLSADYELPFLAHATMEPMNCTADVRADGVEVWVPTQFQTRVQLLGAEIAGVTQDRVQVHTTYLGGGFGRRFETDFTREALETSKTIGAPVKVIWSREDDMQHDFYRPVSFHRLQAGIGPQGLPLAWTHRLVAPSILGRAFGPDAIRDGIDHEAIEGAVGFPYAVPNVGVDYVLVDTGIPVGFWRSVNNSMNAFAVESFIDELAHAAGRDPYEYRRDLLVHNPRLQTVLTLAAEQAQWGTPVPAGRALGIAAWKSFETYVAEVAEVGVAEDGSVRVSKVTCAVDCGPVVNPAIVEAQMQSAIVYGLSAALWGKITIAGGRVEQQNFPDYPVVRLGDMPAIEVHVVESDDTQGGAGEPGTPPIAPAVCNAIFALTGRRIRTLPIGKVV